MQHGNHLPRRTLRGRFRRCKIAFVEEYTAPTSVDTDTPLPYCGHFAILDADFFRNGRLVGPGHSAPGGIFPHSADSAHLASTGTPMARSRRGPVITAGLLIVAAGCSAPAPGVARGEALWDTCVPCHGSNGEGNQALGSPAIAGLPEWYVVEQLEKFQNGWRGSHPMDTVGIRMKSMVRSLDLEGDLESVSAYTATLIPVTPEPTLTGGNAVAGEATYSRICIACHQADAGGFEGVRAPPLTAQHDWYLLSQVQKYRAGWRGANAEDVFGQTMAVNSLQIDEQAMLDVIAYLRELE